MKNPGAAGLTADRLGDSDKWKPKYESCRHEEHGLTPIPQKEPGEDPTAYLGSGSTMLSIHETHVSPSSAPGSSQPLVSQGGQGQIPSDPSRPYGYDYHNERDAYSG